MLTASNADSGDRRNIAVISPPGQCQVISTAECPVGGVTVDPFAVASVNGAPGVGRVGAYQAWLAGWRDSSQVATDIAGGQACRSQCSDLQMREILADSTADTKDFRDWRVDSGGPIVIGKLTMNLRRQRKYGLGQCHFGQQSFSSPLLNCRCPLHFG